MAGTYDVVVNVTDKGTDSIKQKIADLGNKLKEAGQSGLGFGQVMKTVTNSLGGASAAAGELNNHMTSVAKSFNPATLAVGALGTAIGALSLGALKGMVDGIIDGAASLNKLSKQTSVSVEDLSVMAQVAKMSGTSMDTVADAVIKFQRALGASAKETSVQSRAFKELGIDTSDTTKTTQQYLDMAAQKLNGLHDGWQKNLIAMALFGKSGTELNEFLADYAERGDKAAKISTAQAQEAQEYERNLKKLNATANEYKQMLAMGLLPVMSNIAEQLVKNIQGAGKLDQEQRKLIQNGITEWGFAVAKGIAAAIDVGIAFFNVLKGIGIMIGTIIAADVQLVEVINRLVHLDFSGAKDAAIGFGSALKSGMSDAWKAASADSSKYYDTVVRAEDSWRDKLKNPLPIKVDNRPTPGNIGEGDTKEKEPKVDPILAFVANLKKQLDVQSQENDVTIVANELKNKYADSTNTAAKAEALATAGKIDAAKAHKLVNDAMVQMQKNSAGYVNSLEEEQRQRTMGTRDFKEYLEDQKLDIQLTETLNKMYAEHRFNQEEANRLVAENTRLKEANHAATLKSSQADQDWVGGINSALKDYNESADNMFAQSKNAATNAFKTMEDGLVNFAMTGKLNFGDMAKSIIADLIRIQIRAAISGVFKLIGSSVLGAFTGSANAAGGANSAGFGSGAGYGNQDLGGYFADGGSPPVGKASVVGENGPELFIPNSAGTIIPNGQLAGGNMSIGAITINITGGETNEQTAGVMKKELVETMKQIADGRIANAKRVGGLLAKA